MLWFELECDKAVSVMQEIKQKAMDIAVRQLNLASYEMREIRPEDLPSPSTTDFFITVAAGTAFLQVLRRVNSQSLVIICGFYAPDVVNNNQIQIGTNTDFSVPVLKHVHCYRGTNLLHKWPLKPIYATKDHAAITEGYMIFYPEDVIDLRFYAQNTMTVDQQSEVWYIGIVLLPPGATTATAAAT